VKRLLAIIALLVLTFGGMASPAHAASDAQFAATALNCQHSQGAGTPISADYIRINVNGQPTGQAIGAVQLCRSGSYYWAYMVMYSPLRSGYWGTALLYRWDGAKWSCNSSGGNLYVKPGQTMCWTPRIYSPYTSQTFLAQAYVCPGTYPNESSYYAEGQTAWLR
jgi:hypothetical protein